MSTAAQRRRAAERTAPADPSYLADLTDGDADPPQRHRAVPRLIFGVLAINLGCFAVVKAALGRLQVNDPWVDLPVEAVALGVFTAAGLWFVVIQPLREDAERERRETRRRQDELRREAARQEFDARVHRAMDMAGTEADAYAASVRALRRGTPELSAELLLADSSDAHLKRAASAFPDDGAAPGCAVAGPRDCPAIRRSQTLQFASGEEIDSCPHLTGRIRPDQAAVCVPVSVAGRAIGVLHATSAGVSAHEVVRLESLATQAGGRIGVLRVMAATHLQAATDPLTGLLNRRSFENRVQELVTSGVQLCLAMGDLDHFKLLNDTHGHDAGDRALRLFARTLQSSLRGEDVVCRYGGEEFVVAFPDMSPEQAERALQRVQEAMVLALTAGTVPAFTASFGLATFEPGTSLEDTCRVADAALFRAKREGRNRIVTDGALTPPPADRG